MTALIQLGKQSFSIGTTLKDKVRRESYFKGLGDDALTKEEEGILTVLGIDTDIEDKLRSYLAEFFDELPNCQTDTSLLLNKKCEVPHYVIWSTLFDKYTRGDKALKDNRKRFKPRMDILDAMDSVVVEDMKEKKDPDADIKLLFTLMYNDGSEQGLPSESDNHTPDEFDMEMLESAFKPYDIESEVDSLESAFKPLNTPVNSDIDELFTLILS